MNQSKGNFNWIGTYTDWTDADDWAFGSGPPAYSGMEEGNTEAIEEFVSSYLDWADARQ
jgi:hypothetical protein